MGLVGIQSLPFIASRRLDERQAVPARFRGFPCDGANNAQKVRIRSSVGSRQTILTVTTVSELRQRGFVLLIPLNKRDEKT